MKRVRCPKCDQFITFDETRYEAGQRLVFQCSQCNTQFAIKIGSSKLSNTQKNETERLKADAELDKGDFGSIVVIENVFHYKQVLPLRFGENRIGRYQKGNSINTPIETVDPSIDLLHCFLFVSRDKKGNFKYELKDGPSNTGTFVDNEILGDRERRIIYDGQLFTIGATSIILRAANPDAQ